MAVEEYAARVGLSMVSKVAVPAAIWVGGKAVAALGGLGGPPTFGKMLVLLAGGFGTSYLVAFHLEDAVDTVLGGMATAANTTGQVLQVAANQIRNLEKADLEKFLNPELDFLKPIFVDVDTPMQETAGAAGEQKGPKLIAPLLPKDYDVDHFPYYLKEKKVIPKIDPDIDRYIEAYYALGIDVIPMILEHHQLPQLKLVHDIYIRQIRKAHPDKTSADYTTTAATLNDSYALIRTLMKSVDLQFDVIRPVLQFYHKTTFSPLPYILLFVAGGFITILLTS